MHDPQTVAHEIYFGKRKNKKGHYKSPFITIWHVDPEKHALGCRSDDSCGWFSPPYTEQEALAIKKLAQDQYETQFARTHAIRQNKDYYYVCYDQTVHGAIYWSWRALKAHNKGGWQYGKPLTAREIDTIYKLAYNPVDNFQHTDFSTYKNFEDFFFLVWRAFRRFYRPWYKHPKWHIRHWKIQVHPFQNIKRRYWDKCCICGKRGFKGSAHGDWDGTKIWHGECDQSAKPYTQNTQHELD